MNKEDYGFSHNENKMRREFHFGGELVAWASDSMLAQIQNGAEEWERVVLKRFLHIGGERG